MGCAVVLTGYTTTNHQASVMENSERDVLIAAFEEGSYEEGELIDYSVEGSLREGSGKGGWGEKQSSAAVDMLEPCLFHAAFI
jgi:hypothetical protein